MISPVKFETNSRSSTNGEVVQSGIELGQHGLFTAARIDRAAPGRCRHLGGDDEAVGVELHRVRHAEVAGDALWLTAFGIDAPDLVGAHHREVQQPVGADLHGVGRGHVLQQDPRRAAVEVKLHQPAALAALADEQPALVHGDAVGAGQVVSQHAGAAVACRAR